MARELLHLLEVNTQSHIVAWLVPSGGRRATLLIRRGDGQFALQGIDARVASASRVASTWFRQGSPILNPAAAAVSGDAEVPAT